MQISRSRASVALVFALVALTVATITAPRAHAQEADASIGANQVAGGVTTMDVPFSLVQRWARTAYSCVPSLRRR